MIEIFLAAMAGLLSGLTVGGFVHRARYRAWNAERALLKAQIEDDEGISDIDFNEIVETALRNRAMGVEPIGLAALVVRMREAGELPAGIDRAPSEFWNSGFNDGLMPVTYGDLVPPLDWEPDDKCNCQFCDGERRRRRLTVIPGGK
jgi:hypothetical protein